VHHEYGRLTLATAGLLLIVRPTSEVPNCYATKPPIAETRCVVGYKVCDVLHADKRCEKMGSMALLRQRDFVVKFC